LREIFIGVLKFFELGFCCFLCCNRWKVVLLRSFTQKACNFQVLNWVLSQLPLVRREIFMIWVLVYYLFALHVCDYGCFVCPFKYSWVNGLWLIALSLFLFFSSLLLFSAWKISFFLVIWSWMMIVVGFTMSSNNQELVKENKKKKAANWYSFVLHVDACTYAISMWVDWRTKLNDFQLYSVP